MAAHSRDGAIHFVCMDWRHLFELLTAGRSVYSELKNLCVWTKTNGGMGSLYRSQHEFVVVFKKGSAPHINNVDLGRHGRNRTNVWAYAGMNSFRRRARRGACHASDREAGRARRGRHPRLLEAGWHRARRLRGATTLIAAERTGRRGFGLELEPRYVDVRYAASATSPASSRCTWKADSPSRRLSPERGPPEKFTNGQNGVGDRLRYP